ncbi:MAG: PLP-dependent aminotransferase family protein [Bacteroidia bacterium]
MLNAKIPGEKMVMDLAKTPYNYTRANLLLPLPPSFISSFSSRLTDKEAANSGSPGSLIPLYEDFFKHHISKNLAENTLIPVLHKEDLVATLLGRTDWQLVWISPVEDPELLRIASLKEYNHFIHSKEENGWKLSPDQLDTWCKQNSQLVSKSILYLPRPLADNVWKAGEFKRLCEVANKHGVYFLREEYGSTRSDESLLHFYPEKSFVFYNPLFGTNGAGWGLGCLILPQNGAWNTIWTQLTHLENKPLISGLEISALRTYFEEYEAIEALHANWERVLVGLRKEIYELLSVSKLKFKKSQSGNSIFIDFDAYRSHFGRRGAYNSSDLCKRIFQDSKVKLVPGSEVGCPPGTLVAVMFLTNIEDLDWFFEVSAKHVDTSFLYKQCWNCIDGAQKLMRYLNSLE